MKSTKLIIAATLLGGLLTVPAIAATAKVAPKKTAPQIEAPVPAFVVSPVGLPRRHEGSVIKVAMTIDENGQPHDIKIMSPNDSALTRALLPAVSQWQFTPAKKDGVAVTTRVVMPVQVVDEDKA